MAHQSTPPLSPVPVDIRARRWTMRVIALLLTIQALALLGISALYISGLPWRQDLRVLLESPAALDTILLVGLLGPLAIFELATALSMWLLRIGAWLRAMIVQGILLIFCLSSYVAQRGESFIYLLMLTCILIVLYLNTNDVRVTYQTSFFQRRDRSHRA